MKALTPLLWAFTLGVVGLGCGLFGPALLNPSANQGPLLGLFITGPGAFIIGGVAGFIVAALKIRKQQNLYLLGLASFCVAAITFVMSLPEPRYLGFIIDGEIRNCKSPDDLMPNRIKWWSATNADTKWRQPRAGWEDDTKRMLATDKGSVIEIYVYRERKIYENQKPWNEGQKKATAWHIVNAAKSYYARSDGNTCEVYKNGLRQLYFPEWEASQVSPPDILPTFLGLFVLEEIPDKYKALIKD